MYYLKYFIFYLTITLGVSVSAQEQHRDSTIYLKEFIINTNRLENFSSGTKIQKIDSTTLSQYQNSNLSGLLENESPVFIKSYGLGSLATSSFRGGSAHHTAVLWNGFNIGSPMNGQLDLSLVPTNFMNNINIQYGGSSTLWGSGAVGGAIHLSNEYSFNKGLSVIAGSHFGSFKNFGQNIQIEISKKKWISSLKIFHTTSKNNFRFFNSQLQDAPLQIQSNAELSQLGLISENIYQINSRQKIKISFWFQDNHRNIPPNMLQLISNANQKDQSYRFSSEWQHVKDKMMWLVRTAYFNENLTYSDFGYNIQSYSRSRNFILETESKIQLHQNHLLNIGVNNTFTSAASNGYTEQKKQNRFALFSSYKYHSKNEKLNACISLRQEIIENSLVPFTYSAGSDYTITKWISIRGNVARVYRVPTLNDLFWNPGGNPDLLPEDGFSEEIGLLIQLKNKKSNVQLFFEPTLFNRNINNWILWSPEQSYWKPKNIMEVWSRGIETRSELSIKYKAVLFKINVITNYVVSTNQKTKTENDASIDKQLIYVPMYGGHAKLTILYKQFLLSYNQNYTGYRYTSSDNSQFLNPYHLSHIYFAYKIFYRKVSINLFTQINNLFNESYQVILNRAMPLRNYQAGLTIQFHQNNNKLKEKP